MDKLKQMMKRLLEDAPLEASFFARWQALYRLIFESRWTILLLLVIGLVRGLLFLVAYAPADGADGGDYYLYAAYMAGYDLPPRSANLSPMYPFFLYLNHYVIGQFNLIILWQFLMSMSLGMVMYLGLRRYHPVLAFMVAGVVLGDAQIGVLFNFASTEPLYIFLLCVMYALAVAIPEQEITARWSIRSTIVGILLALLRETRTVATYIFVPVMTLYTLHTRRWRHMLTMIVSFGLTAVLLSSAFTVLQVEQRSSANHLMFLRPLVQFDMLDPDAGDAAAQLHELTEACRADPSTSHLASCIVATTPGDETTRAALYQQAYAETLSANPLALIETSLGATFDFLRLSGQQYGTEDTTPARVQCMDIEARTERWRNFMLTVDWVDLTLSDTQRADLDIVTRDFTSQMCPTWYESDLARTVTDYMSLRYRSLSRPNPVMWNVLLFSAIVLVPWMRRFWHPYLLAVGLWLYHASISGVLLNVQARYVAVTNPLRAVIICLMLFLVAQAIIRVMDWVLLSREQKGEARHGEHSH